MHPLNVCFFRAFSTLILIDFTNTLAPQFHAWKTNNMVTRWFRCLENSYKMIPDAKFNFERARRPAEDVLHRKFHGVKYKTEKCNKLTVQASEELKNCIKGLFTRRWGTPGKWGNPLKWGKPPVRIISHFNLSRLHDRWGDPAHVTSPIWGPPPPR